nr:hypothetical protein [uncultured Desulfobacter sp.]
MKTENKKTKCKIDNHGKNSTQNRAKKCDKLQRSRQQSSQGFNREDTHILKKRIVKILTKKDRVRFDKLLHKLDIPPSVLAKALAKLEGHSKGHESCHRKKGNRSTGSCLFALSNAL